MGRLRAVKALLTYWRIVDESGFEAADGKVQLGSTIQLLGMRLYLNEGLVIVTPTKQRQYNEWLERVDELDFLEAVEFRSLMGSLNFGILTVPGHRKRLGRAYRALHSPKPWDFAHGRLGRVLGPEVKEDFRVLKEAFKDAPGVVLMDELEDFWPSSEEHVGFTDACKEVGGYSGMGGVFKLTGRWWWADLTDEEAFVLPIHITEMVAEIVNLRLNAKELKNSKVEAWCDNAAVVSVLKTQSSRDQRMVELLLVRQALLESYNITTIVEWIASEDNKMADLISRGDIEEFLELAKSEVGSPLEEVDVRGEGVIPDLEWLMRRMIQLTPEKKAEWEAHQGQKKRKKRVVRGTLGRDVTRL